MSEFVTFQTSLVDVPLCVQYGGKSFNLKRIIETRTRISCFDRVSIDYTENRFGEQTEMEKKM